MQAQYIASMATQKLLDEGPFQAVVRICFDMLCGAAAQLACLAAPPPPHAHGVADSFLKLCGAIARRSDAPLQVWRLQLVFNLAEAWAGVFGNSVNGEECGGCSGMQSGT